MLKTFLSNLLPQDKVVVYECIQGFGTPRYEEVMHYVDWVDNVSGVIHALTDSGHKKSITFEDVIDVEIATDPILATVCPELWDRFGGDPQFSGQPVRLSMIDIYDNRIHGFVVPLHPGNTVPEGALRALRVKKWDFIDWPDIDDRTLITKLPAGGYCHRRYGYSATFRDRTYRTARGRINKFLHKQSGTSRTPPPDPSTR